MDLSALFNDPEAMAALSELGIFDDEHDAVTQQMQMAQALRGTPMPDGRQAGGTFIASNPLEMIGAVGTRIAGMQQMKNAQQQRTDLLGREKSAAQRLAELLRGAGVEGQNPDRWAPSVASNEYGPEADLPYYLRRG